MQKYRKSQRAHKLSHTTVEYHNFQAKREDFSAAEKHDHRIKRFVADSEHTQVCTDKGTTRKGFARQMHRINRAAAKMPLQSSKQIFEAAASRVPRSSRSRILQRHAVMHQPSICPPLTIAHKQKRRVGPEIYGLIFTGSPTSAVQLWMVLTDGSSGCPPCPKKKAAMSAGRWQSHVLG